MNSASLALVKMALEEDLQDVGDLTSQNFVDENHESVGRIVSREEAVISGLEVAEEVCSEVDNDMRFVALIADGEVVRSGDVVCELLGKTRSILTAERTVLNFLQRLSGVATISKTFVDSIEGTGAVLLDTRKTTPGWRALEKSAVVHGGATNHRIGLYDAVMVKDNHLAANLTPINLADQLAAFKNEHSGLKIEVEADRLDQVEAFLKIDGIDVILLDNMSNHQLASAVEMRDKLGVKIKLEASGSVTLKTVRGIAETGVDFISVGALTHSVRSIDLGLDLFS
ncbi:MAG: nicotinate-nucleotide diphosphorylase (carboxylating) [Verrucomicrobiales bacterium]|jgi:nicotinate-nucleotide pyrophosphorylase (carboxylating)|nr:nicotinate-nucleotide diphosphorylase (carboxylating) [Verrucomicrobiales bacterium]|tara:strand:+ start:294 stop:1145 length:852 start_codon:yes stop_codon:yes gene_type:complete